MYNITIKRHQRGFPKQKPKHTWDKNFEAEESIMDHSRYIEAAHKSWVKEATFHREKYVLTHWVTNIRHEPDISILKQAKDYTFEPTNELVKAVNVSNKPKIMNIIIEKANKAGYKLKSQDLTKWKKTKYSFQFTSHGIPFKTIHRFLLEFVKKENHE